MTDEEKQQIALAESDALADLKRIEELIATAKTQRAEQFVLLSMLKPWKARGVTKKAWIVEVIGCKPSWFEQEVSLIKKYGDEMAGFIKSRLLSVVSHKFESPQAKSEWLDTWCRPETSHEHFKSAYAELKGLHDPLACSCQNLVFLTKCKTCGKVKKDALSPKE